jgi:hypothetical protein
VHPGKEEVVTSSELRLLIKAAIVLPIFLYLFRDRFGRLREGGRWRIALLRVVVGAALVGAAAWIATGIDAGTFSDQTRLERSLMVGLMLVGVACGVVVALSWIWLEDGDGPLPLRALLWSALAASGIVALVELGYYLERSQGIYHGRFPLAVLGVGIAALTIVRPWWFWSHPKAMFLRGLIGDHSTALLYLLIAGVTVGSATVLPWPPGKLRSSRTPAFDGTMTECFEFEPGPADRYGFNGRLGLQPGYETGFALWMPALPSIPPSAARRDTTTTYTAYEGTWHRRGGDSLEFRIRRDGHDTWARLTLAPGDPIRVGMIEADPSVFGTSATSEFKILPVRARRSECRVQVRAGPPPRG